MNLIFHSNLRGKNGRSNRNEHICRYHQSRIIEVEDWDTYCNAFELYDGKAICFKSKQMPGNSIQANRKRIVI